MFTGMIQSLLNSSGQVQAEKRARQISNYVQSQARTQELVPEVEFKTFEDVMNSSLNVHTRFNTNKPAASNVKFGSLTNHKKIQSVKDDLREVQAKRVDSNPFDEQLTSLPIAPIKVMPTEKSHIKQLVSKISKKHGVDEKLVDAVIKQESGYNPKAKSSAGAQGLMQLMPATAKAMGVSDPYNPVQNVEGGVKYLKSMMDRYNNNIVLALAAYNAGPGNVDKYNGVPPFKETQGYVKNVLANYL